MLEQLQSTDRILGLYGLFRNADGTRQGDMLPTRENALIGDKWRAGLIVWFVRAIGTCENEFHVIYTGNPSHAGSLYARGGEYVKNESELAYNTACMLAYLLDR